MSKILVAYYSAQGHTRRIAETIARKLGADLFEMQPVRPYSEEDFDWTNLESRVSQEHSDENMRNIDLIQEVPDGWNDYDVVLIGYPVWYGIAAWPVNRFIKINSFIDKTVIPFATSHSSPLGDSDQLLHEMTSSGNWREGMRFYQDAPESELESWAESLGL